MFKFNESITGRAMSELEMLKKRLRYQGGNQ